MNEARPVDRCCLFKSGRYDSAALQTPALGSPAVTLVCVLAAFFAQAAPEGEAYPPAPPRAGDPGKETAHVFLMYYDVDKDGLLSIDELPLPLRKHFVRTDIDADGHLDAREILTAKNPIGREARRAEKLKLTRHGLERRNGLLRRNDEVAFRVQTELLQRLDQNHDGYADQRELGTLLQEQGIVFGDRPFSLTPADAQALAANQATTPPPYEPPASSPLVSTETPHGPPSAFDPGLLPKEIELPPRPDFADPIAQTYEPAPSRPQPPATPAPRQQPAPSGGGLPTSEQILANLDKNGNGQLDRAEAVDQLAANFDRLDRNRDNMLSDKELKRGLFLARMFGVKPKRDPRTYQNQP